VRRAALMDAFMADLRALDRVVLIFDTFEMCDKTLQAWLTYLLPRVARSPQRLVVIIAGREVPKPSLEWESHCRIVSLEPIAPEYWLTYARAVGATSLSLDYIKGCSVALKGHCLSIANILESRGGRHI
jgi:hypothetical protein